MLVDPPYNGPIQGHVSGLGRHHHEEFAMASGEMSEAEFVTFLEKTLGLHVAHSTDGAIHFVCMDWRLMGELRAAASMKAAAHSALASSIAAPAGAAGDPVARGGTWDR